MDTITQSDMNSEAGNSLRAAQDKMITALEELKERSGLDDDLIDAAQATWTAFCEIEARLHASVVKGGTMYPSFHAASKEHLVTARTDQINKLLAQTQNI